MHPDLSPTTATLPEPPARGNRPDVDHVARRPAGRSPGLVSYDAVKRGFDLAAAATLAVLLSPVMAVVAVLVRLTSAGPAIYTQVRLGRNGVPYTIYKFRSMANNCEKVSGIRWCVPGDSRVTAVGRFIRATHLDELPQLWNVLCGDMSLVGPRPERPELVATLENALPCYRERLDVRPGVTGLAQIQLPPDTDLNSVRRKLTLDRCYVRQVGLWLDLRVLAGTAFYLFKVPGRVTRRAFALPGLEEAIATEPREMMDGLVETKLDVA